MNEVTKIHLGRQAFTISVDAHHELRDYLDDIEKAVKDKDVINEIELRMAELLSEHGIDGSKVILPADVSFLKEQLGNPADFSESEDEPQTADSKPPEGRRLFRDTDNAMVAGVAAGLAKYFGIDALIVRLLFVLLIFITFGGGILLYIILWLLVPEAKTSSERLQMAGKPVTVGSLKEIVEHADVKGAAQRANNTIAGPINALFRFILKVIGIAFIISGLSMIFGLVAGETYYLSRGSNWLQYNIFPVGFRENLLLDCAITFVALIAVFIILCGLAMFRRKWPIRSWITGVLVGLVFISLAVGSALGADVYPAIHHRYNTNVHTTTRSIKPFSAINADSSNITINFQTASSYYVTLQYYDHPNLTSVKTTVDNGVLVVYSSQFNDNRNCQTLCLPPTYNLSITVYSPNANNLENQDESAPIPASPPMILKQPQI